MPVEPFRKHYAIVNVKQLEAKFEPGEVVTPEELGEKRRIIDKDIEDGVRILGDGELTKPLTVYAHHFSASAKAKIEGGGRKSSGDNSS
jgi:large subunit ribosomal protein L15